MYIGKSIEPEVRWGKHLVAANSGSQYVFHRALRRYGAHNFSFDILEVCETEEESYIREIYWIAAHDTLVDNGWGYNMTKGGEGVRMTPEGEIRRIEALRKANQCPKVRARRKEIMLALWQDPSYIANHSAAMNDPEFKEKHRAACILAWNNEEQRAHHRESCNTPEYKALKQDSALKQWQNPEYVELRRQITNSDEHKAKHSAAMNAPDHILRVSEAAKQQWATPGFREKWYALMESSWNCEEFKAKQRSHTLVQWDDPEFRRKQKETRSTDDFKQRHKAGLDRHHNTPERKAIYDRIVELTLAGMSQEKIGREVGLSGPTVCVILKKLGVVKPKKIKK